MKGFGTQSLFWLVGCFVLFYGVSTLLGSFNTELNFKQFSLASVHSLILFKNSSISNNSV